MNRIIVYTGLIILSLITAYLLFKVNQHDKIAMIDVVKLFNEFDMKKDLEVREAARLKQLRNEVDSVEKILTIMQQSNKAPDKSLIAHYSSSKYVFEEEYKNGNQELNEQIWKRLNPMLDDFGKKKGYHLLLGANGMGNVLYHSDYFDVTQDAIEYINKSYAQKN